MQLRRGDVKRSLFALTNGGSMGKLLLLKESLDGTESRDQEKARFRHWHVEDLLNQAADLTDRCLSQRNLLRQLVERRRELVLQAAVYESEAKKTDRRIKGQWFSAEAQSLGAATDIEASAQRELEVARDIAAEQVIHDTSNPPSETQNQREKEAALLLFRAGRATRDSWREALWADVPEVVAEAESRVTSIRAWLDEVFVAWRDVPPAERVTLVDEQIEALEKSIKEDFQDAFNRAEVAQQGIRLIYGSDASEPKVSGLPTKGALGDLSLLDGVTLWVREAIRWLTTVRQLDQEFTLLVSMKRVLGETAFTSLVDALKSGNAHECKFALSAKDVPTHRFVRFRGMRAATVDCKATLQGVLWFPRLAYSTQWSGDVEVQQDEVPPCLLGRIDDRSQGRPPDLLSPGALVNVSPFGDTKGPAGQFRLRLSAVSAVESVADVYLEFFLVGIGRP